jgi:hypothetical protein
MHEATQLVVDPSVRYYQAMFQLKESIEDCLSKGRVTMLLTTSRHILLN